MSVFVTYRQFDSLVNSIIKTNMKTHGRSLSGASMRGGDLILDIQDDYQGMIMRDDWRAEMRKRYLQVTAKTITFVNAKPAQTTLFDESAVDDWGDSEDLRRTNGCMKRLL